MFEGGESASRDPGLGAQHLRRLSGQSRAAHPVTGVLVRLDESAGEPRLARAGTAHDQREILAQSVAYRAELLGGELALRSREVSLDTVAVEAVASTRRQLGRCLKHPLLDLGIIQTGETLPTLGICAETHDVLATQRQGHQKVRVRVAVGGLLEVLAGDRRSSLEDVVEDLLGKLAGRPLLGFLPEPSLKRHRVGHPSPVDTEGLTEAVAQARSAERSIDARDPGALEAIGDVDASTPARRFEPQAVACQVLFELFKRARLMEILERQLAHLQSEGLLELTNRDAELMGHLSAPIGVGWHSP